MKYHTIEECLRAIKRLEDSNIIYLGSAKPEYDDGYWFINYDIDYNNKIENIAD